MLLKLSLSSIKSKFKDYIVLLIGLVISISIFYMFQTLALNESFLKSNSIISQIVIVFKAGSILLSIITFFYLLYANSFLLSLRQKEFGMFMMLGAKKKKITLLMCLEILILGLTSLAIGLTVGVGLAQLIGSLLMKQLEFSSDGYHAFYLPSLIITCAFFMVLFVLSAIMNSLKLSKVTILELVHGDNQTDKIAKFGKMTVVKAILSIILLAIGYTSMFHMQELQVGGMFIALFTITPGTYLLFGSFLPLLIKGIKSNKKRMEKGLNVFTYAQLNFRINNLTKVLATVTMLIALGAGAISAGMAFKNNIMTSLNSISVYDVITHNPSTEEQDILSKITFDEKRDYSYKTDDQFVYYIKDELESQKPLVKDRTAGQIEAPTVPVSGQVADGEVLDRGTNEQWFNAFIDIEPYYVHPDKSVKIVSQEEFNALPEAVNHVFLGVTDNFLNYQSELQQLDTLQFSKYDMLDKNHPESLSSKIQNYKGLNAMFSGTVFMGFFLGIAFLAMMASCLMFKILSGASKDITRYRMLQKIGVRTKVLEKSIRKELFMIFLFPAIIGLVHVVLGMNIFSFILPNPHYKIWIPITIFLVIYTIYYLITVKLYKGIVLSKSNTK